VTNAEVTIYSGGVHAALQPTVIKTLLGSCIAVCLYDPVRAVGGMNHFLLPRGNGDGDDTARFGVHAMDRLIGATMKAGGDRRRFVAKVFGGANVLDVKISVVNVAQRNIDFINTFLEEEGIPVLSKDVGGRYPRHLRFHTETGRAFVKRVRRLRQRLLADERDAATSSVAYGGVTLFE
jgi:chemotaxis receptor (MCP) glutamine deamidase CheD